MTNNDKATAIRTFGTTRAAETNAMTFTIPKKPDISRNFSRSTPRTTHTRKAIR